MAEAAKHGVEKAGDAIQERLTNYAVNLNFDSVVPEAASAAKVRLINTCGALMAGFFSDPGRVVRRVAAHPRPARRHRHEIENPPDVVREVNTTRGVCGMGDTSMAGELHGHPGT